MYNFAMKVSELGEFGLIDLLANIVGKSGGAKPRPDLLVAIGDDAAAWLPEGTTQLGTTDTMVQDVHFTLGTITWEELGWKALAANLSDIAAMGGAPRYALISLGLPGDTEVESVAELYEGMAQLARQFDVAIVGGDIVGAPLVIISLAVVGSAGDTILTRSAALPGDQIAVAGYLGSSAAGLKMLSNRLEFDPETASFLREAHLRPQPRVAVGQALVAHGVATAIDISDGLIGDLGQICKMSKVGARIRVDRVPVHPLVRAAFGEDALALALSGGEDYELLFTGRIEVIEQVKKTLPSPVTVIGEIVGEEPGKVTLLDEKGNLAQWEKTGWNHFASSKRL